MGEPAKKIPQFSDRDVDNAINRALTTQEQDRYIEKTYHIDHFTLDDLDLAYPGIRDAALYPSEHPAEYENALIDLLNRIKEIKEANIAAKTMPYEIPLMPKKLPVAAFEIIYPDFVGTLGHTEKDVMEALTEITAENSMARKKEAMASLKEFFDEEERKMAITDKNIEAMRKKTRKQFKKLPPLKPKKQPSKSKELPPLELELDEDFPEGK